MKKMNTKRLLLSATVLLMMLLFVNPVANAQVLISDDGATDPDASAALEVRSTSQGFLMPRMTTTQRQAINSGTPTAGTMVIDTDLNSVMVYGGAGWTSLGASVMQEVTTFNQNTIRQVEATSVLGVWESQSSGTTSTNKSIDYETSLYTLESGSSTSIEVNGGQAQMLLVNNGYTANESDLSIGESSSSTFFYNEPALGFDPDNAFDDEASNPNTLWSSVTHGSFPIILEYDFGVGKQIEKYSLETRWKSDITTTRQPKEWYFEGFNGVDWDELDHVVGQVAWAIDEVREFSITNSTNYQRYRFRFVNNISENADNGIEIVDAQMFGVDYIYNTTEGYYISTTDDSNIDHPNISELTSLVISSTGDASSKFAVSVNGRGAWYYFDGSNWVAMGLSDFDTKGTIISSFTSTSISTLFSDLGITSCNNFDIAIDLKAINSTTNATVSNVLLNYGYSTGSFFKKMELGNTTYEVRRSTATGKQNIEIIKLSSGSADVIIDYLK